MPFISLSVPVSSACRYLVCRLVLPIVRYGCNKPTIKQPGNRTIPIRVLMTVWGRMIGLEVFFLNLSGMKRAGSRWFFAESARTGMCKLLYFFGSRAVLSHGSPADGYSQSECQGCLLRSLRMSANRFSTASSSGMLRSTHTCLRYREMRPLPAPT